MACFVLGFGDAVMVVKLPIGHCSVVHRLEGRKTVVDVSVGAVL